MARKYHTHVREKKASEFTVTIPGLEEYKNAWLVICNNAREYPESFYKVSNDPHDRIYVLCAQDDADEVSNFLSQFGELERYDDKIAVLIDVECDYDNFDKDYIDSDYALGETD